MRALALAFVLLSDAAGAQAVAVTRADLTLKDGTSKAVGEGCYLDSGSCLMMAKELADLRMQNAELRMAPAPTPKVVILLAIGILAAGGVGFLTGRILPR